MAEKQYQVRCLGCGFVRWLDAEGGGSDGLHEVGACGGCGGPKKYRCPQCGATVKATRYEAPPAPPAPPPAPKPIGHIEKPKPKTA